MNNNNTNDRPSDGQYKPSIQRKRWQPRQSIRRLLRSFEPLKPPVQQQTEPLTNGQQ